MSRFSNHNQIPDDYLHALTNYWNGRPQTAVEHVSLLLAERPEREDRFILYRFWIDVLADQKDVVMLKSLSDHLHILGMIDADYAPYYMSLRGTIHFELDEVEAAKLYARTVKQFENNQYARELLYMLEQRTSSEPVAMVSSKEVSNLNDYFHLKCALGSAHECSDDKLIKATSNRIAKLYPSSPLLEQYKVQTAFQQQQYPRAIKVLEGLSSDFPANHDYLVYSAFAAAKSGQYQPALKYLGKLMTLGCEDDLDVNLLFADCYRNLFEQTGDAQLRDKLEYFEQRVEELWNAEESSNKVLSISDKKENTMNSSKGRDVKAWMVKLTAAEYYDLQSKQQEEIVHTLSETAVPGDIVVFVGDDYQNPSRSWRIGSVYSVESEPTWHPVRGFECHLSAMHRLEASIPFEVRLDKQVSAKSAVIELDRGAIDLLIEAVQDFSGQDEVNIPIIHDLERMRLSS